MAITIDLKGKNALVTGASRGIGKEIALTLASAGANVAITYSSSSAAAEEVVSQIKANGVDSFAIQANASDFSKAQEVVDHFVDSWGTIDILVNNAGITRDNLLLRMSEEQWDEVLLTNLKSVFNYCKAAARPMMKQKQGSVINIGSVVGISGNAGQCNYSASKAGLIGFTKSFAKELASRYIRANVVAPGYITTDMTGELDPEVLRSITESTPLSRAGEPAEVANTVLFLASDWASYITGETIRVDGGMAI